MEKLIKILENEIKSFDISDYKRNKISKTIAKLRKKVIKNEFKIKVIYENANASKSFFKNIVAELNEKNKILTEHEEELKKLNKDFTDSINYAKKIQQSILPDSNLLNKYFENHFIINKPASIVSGDFFYIDEKNEHLIFAVADCTGHGVPGGFMTILGITLLNDIVKSSSIKTPDLALNILRNKIKKNLKHKGSQIKDGLDIALCEIKKASMNLKYSGAYRPLYIIRKEKLIEYKANRMPIGIYPYEKPFSGYEIKIQKGDLLYLFSDGFTDQIGGKFNRKFMTKKFKNLLIQISSYDVRKQKTELLKIFDLWKKDNIQTDDLLIMCIKV